MSELAGTSLRWRVAQFLERRWWRRYLARKSPEIYLADKRAYWRRMLAEVGWAVVPGRRVLDAGCGPAGVFIYLAETEALTALDPLLEDYEADLAIFQRQDYPAVRFLAEPLETYRVGEPYAAIYCCNAINHVGDWEAALDALTASARSGTQLLLTSDVHRHGWLLPIFRALPGDVLHPQQHGAEAYRAALEERGWRIEREVRLRRTMIFDYVAWVATLGGT